MRSVTFQNTHMGKLKAHLEKEDTFAVLVMLGGVSITVKEPVTTDSLGIIGTDIHGDDFIFSADAVVGFSLSYGEPQAEDAPEDLAAHLWQEAFASLRIACAKSEDPDIKAALATLEEIETDGAN